jgi:single-strand DNA-binding protein
MNKITLIGNLTRDPELTETAQGKKLCRFTIAVGRTFDKEKTDFFSCTAWEQKAEVIAKYVRKGNKLCVVGRLEINETEKDGVKTRHHNIIVDEIEFLTPKSETDRTSPEPSIADLTPADDNNLPF